mmetsp:Transcript_52002/g.118594  ORF Transcript_52002/g.118594 Transcript_52002/m.118594 type:complete len:544 (-) Transcript_52002:354-1985(-)
MMMYGEGTLYLSVTGRLRAEITVAVTLGAPGWGGRAGVIAACLCCIICLCRCACGSTAPPPPPVGAADPVRAEVGGERPGFWAERCSAARTSARSFCSGVCRCAWLSRSARASSARSFASTSCCPGVNAAPGECCGARPRGSVSASFAAVSDADVFAKAEVFMLVFAIDFREYVSSKVDTGAPNFLVVGLYAGDLKDSEIMPAADERAAETAATLRRVRDAVRRRASGPCSLNRTMDPAIPTTSIDTCLVVRPPALLPSISTIESPTLTNPLTSAGPPGVILVMSGSLPAGISKMNPTPAAAPGDEDPRETGGETALALASGCTERSSTLASCMRVGWERSELEGSRDMATSCAASCGAVRPSAEGSPGVMRIAAATPPSEEFSRDCTSNRSGVEWREAARSRQSWSWKRTRIAPCPTSVCRCSDSSTTTCWPCWEAGRTGAALREGGPAGATSGCASWWGAGGAEVMLLLWVLRASESACTTPAWRWWVPASTRGVSKQSGARMISDGPIIAVGAIAPPASLKASTIALPGEPPTISTVAEA